MSNLSSQSDMSLRTVAQAWWPLAASWLLMSIEGPAMSAIVARLADAEINLAAWGGIVFPLALIVESPIIMLLAASTALSRDWDSYVKLRRFMMILGASLTALHVLIAFTPLYYFVVGKLIGAPAEIIEPARAGMMIMTPWTWSIAYRRFNQGVLIRFGRSRAVTVGTMVRLGAIVSILLIGYTIGDQPGIVVASCAIASGVCSEAVYTALRVWPVVRRNLKLAPPVDPPLTARGFLAFYIPLAMTSLLSFALQPVFSAALSRMPNALASLAVWPVVSGFTFIPRSLSMAYNEVVVAQLDEPRSVRSLYRFTGLLSGATSALLLVAVATPLAEFWFMTVSALAPSLATLGRLSLWLALPTPGLVAWQSWFQGTILHSRHTRGITEAVAIFLLTASVILWGGVAWGQVQGLYVGLAGYTTGILAQTGWLWFRSRPAMRAVWVGQRADA